MKDKRREGEIKVELKRMKGEIAKEDVDVIGQLLGSLPSLIKAKGQELKIEPRLIRFVNKSSGALSFSYSLQDTPVPFISLRLLSKDSFIF